MRREIVTDKVASLQVCWNPLYGISFDGTSGILRFCCDHCQKLFLTLRAVASLLVPLGKQKAWKVLEELEHGREGRPKQGVRQGAVGFSA